MTIPSPTHDVEVELTVNGTEVRRRVSVRLSLADMLRDHLGLTGTHLGCEQGACGACTVVMDDRPVRSCITLAVQASGRRVRTAEGLADGDCLHPLQEAFLRHRAFQCGYCTPGMLMLLQPVVDAGVPVDRDTLTDLVGGNVCRCTGYRPIIDAAEDAVCTVADDHGVGA